MCLEQPSIMKKIEKTFQEVFNSTNKYKTPVPPNFNVLRPQNETDCFSVNEQKLYQSGVGSLLYLTKHSKPDISNAVRELSKSMDHVTEGAMKELL